MSSYQNKDIRWQQRFENLEKAFLRLNEALDGIAKEPNNHLYQIALIGAFQFTFELSWKTLKDYLAYNGIDASLPRDVIKQAFKHELIREGEVWIAMLEDRHSMAHVYQEHAAISIVKKIREQYAIAIEDVKDFLKKKKS